VNGRRPLEFPLEVPLDPKRGGKDHGQKEAIINGLGNHACDYLSCSDSNGSIWRQWKLGILLEQCRVRFFFDLATVSRSPQGIVRVSWKEVFKTKEVLRSRGFTGSEYEKVDYQINVTEINCPGKKWRRRFFMLCSGEINDTVCDIHKEKSDKWVPIRQEQPIGALYGKVCR